MLIAVNTLDGQLLALYSLSLLNVFIIDCLGSASLAIKSTSLNDFLGLNSRFPFMFALLAFL
jgi:hypothetical protein